VIVERIAAELRAHERDERVDSFAPIDASRARKFGATKIVGVTAIANAAEYLTLAFFAPQKRPLRRS
jgi:hypothetical protein